MTTICQVTKRDARNRETAEKHRSKRRTAFRTPWKSWPSASFRKFLQYIATESQGGAAGDDGGSITLSHAFRSERMREAYRARFGDELHKVDAECFVWKESLAVSNYLRAQNVPIDGLLARNQHVRFVLPI